MRRSYQYRIYPNAAQTEKLVWMLDRCRELYYAALEERREAYRMCGISINRYQQVTQLPAIKADRPEYKEIGSQVSQDVLERLDKAFAAFFKRVPRSSGWLPWASRPTGRQATRASKGATATTL